MHEELNFIVASYENCTELAFFNKCLIDDGGSYNNLSLQELESRMYDFISSGYTAIIFEVGNKNIGYALIDTKKSPIFIRHYFIAQPFRRKGYGKTAFNKLIDFLGVNKIDLSVLANNDIGYNFWISCGLVPYEIQMHYRK